MSETIRCVHAGIDAEFRRNMAEAQAHYEAAWNAVVNDYDACVAAHYMAHSETTPKRQHAWNLEAMRRAERLDAERAAMFLPSLHVNLGRSYERIGDLALAHSHYQRASQLGLQHQPALDSASD